MAASERAAEPATNGRTGATPEVTEQLAAVQWDDSRMTTHFANVVNIQSTLEQVDLFFGTNKTWNIGNERQVKVELAERVILSPHAAKRLSIALDAVMKEYEARHGALKIEGR